MPRPNDPISTEPRTAAAGTSADALPFQNLRAVQGFPTRQDDAPSYTALRKVPQVCSRACETNCAIHVVIGTDSKTGIEKAITLMNIAKARHIDVSWEHHGETVSIHYGKVKFDFTTLKKLEINLVHETTRRNHEDPRSR